MVLIVHVVVNLKSGTWLGSSEGQMRPSVIAEDGPLPNKIALNFDEA